MNLNYAQEIQMNKHIIVLGGTQDRKLHNGFKGMAYIAERYT